MDDKPILPLQQRPTFLLKYAQKVAWDRRICPRRRCRINPLPLCNYISISLLKPLVAACKTTH